MSVEHRSFLPECFNRLDVPLFTEACRLPEESLPDVNDGVPDYQANTAAVEAHVRMIIDRIIDLTPRLAEHLLS